MNEQQVSEAPSQNDKEFRTWAMVLHFSLLAGYVVPLAGLIAPIVIWQVKKDTLPQLDAHGKVVVNWLISAIIYGFVCGLLAFILIGIPLLAVLGILFFVFPVIGGIKANEGQLWKYPLSIEFLK